MGTVTWDGTVAKVKRADGAVLAAGTYGVTVNGLGTTALTATGTVAAEKATTIAINSERVNPAAAQAISYTVKNQYGDSMTVAPAAITVQTYNTTNATRTVTGTSLANLNFTAASVNDVVKITAYLTADPSVKVVKDITVSNISTGSVSLGDATLPTGTTRFTAGTAGVVIPVTAKDNFNNSMKLAVGPWTTGNPTADGLIPTFTGTSFSSVAVNADGNLVVTLGTAGTATLTITNPATGDVITKTITVVAASDTAKIALAQPTNTVRMGATSDIPFTLTDQFGGAMTTASAGWATTDVVLSSTNTSVATVAWVGNAIRVTPVSTGTTTIYANVVTPVADTAQGVAMITITVNAAKAPATISLNGTPKTALAQGETVAGSATTGALKFNIVDQDGQPVNLAGTGVAGVKANVTLTDPSSVLAAPAASVLMAGNMSGTTGTTNGIAVTAAAVNGTATVSAQLFNDANANDVMDAGEELASTASATYTVSANALTNGAITGLGTVVDGDAANSTTGYNYVTTAAASHTNAFTATYTLQDQAGQTYRTGAAETRDVVWTVTNNGTDDASYQDAQGTWKTLAAGATATVTTTVAASSTNTTFIVDSAVQGDLTVTAKLAGNDSSLKTVKVAYVAAATNNILATSNPISSTITGTIVGIEKDGDHNGTVAANDGTVLVVKNSLNELYTITIPSTGFAGTLTLKGNTVTSEAVLEGTSGLAIGQNIQLVFDADGTTFAGDTMTIVAQ